jgi:hypothetical protein
MGRTIRNRFLLVITVVLATSFLTTTLLAQIRLIKVWSKKDTLKWSDFKGEVDNNSTFDAHTISGDTIIYNWHQMNGKYDFHFEGYSLMDMQKSWVRPEKKEAYLLTHEQGHFDISEFFLDYLYRI